MTCGERRVRYREVWVGGLMGRVEGIVGWVDGIVGRIERMSEKERDCRPIYLDADAERERQGEDEE